jgi:VanZ family protein
MLIPDPKVSVYGWRWGYPIALAAMVVVASGRSQVAAPSIVNIDKLVHFSIFGLIASLVVRLLGGRRWWAAVVLVSAFGVSDEIRQSFTPGRSMEFADWVADTAGALVAVLLYANWAWYRRLLESPICFRRRGVLPVSPLVPPIATL